MAKNSVLLNYQQVLKCTNEKLCFTYVLIDAGALQIVQADTTHGNEPNMSDSKALKQEKKIGHLDDPKEVAQRVQYVFL